MQILVVEDRPRMARLPGRAHRQEGHTGTVAFDGEQAVEFGRSPDLDVILLDVALPIMDGFTDLRTLRAGSRIA
jgi:DNA-binding response OmpR family regulator